MKHSLSYHITLFIIKLKGLKKNFSESPVPYERIRKEDVHQPKGAFFKGDTISNFKVLNTTVTSVKNDSSKKLLIFIHGGAFVSGPSQIHWDTVKQLAQKTNYNIWLCDYPKAPEHKISEITKNIAAVYEDAIKSYGANDITLIGDSVGGTLITTLVQGLIKQQQKLPAKIILLSPVMHAAMTHPEIDIIDSSDPMLSKAGILSAKKMCADDNDLESELISPINGSFENFPPTILFLAENDITYPDQKLVAQKLIDASVNLEIIEGKGMPHIWPILPVMKEAKIALQQIVTHLRD